MKANWFVWDIAMHYPMSCNVQPAPPTCWTRTPTRTALCRRTNRAELSGSSGAWPAACTRCNGCSAASAVRPGSASSSWGSPVTKGSRTPWTRRWHWRSTGTVTWQDPCSSSGNRRVPRSDPSGPPSVPSGWPCPTCRSPRPCTWTRRQATTCSACSWRPPFRCRTEWPRAAGHGSRSANIKHTELCV